MKINFKLKQHNKAVSSIIGWFLVLILISTVTAVVLISSREAISNKKNIHVTDAVASAFKELDENIVSSLSTSNVSKTMELSVGSGSLSVDPKGNRIVVMYSYHKDYDFNVKNLEIIDFEELSNQATVEEAIAYIMGMVDITMTAPKAGVTYEVMNLTMIQQLDKRFISGVLLQLNSTDYPPDPPDDPAIGHVSFGAIWVFDLGRLTYDSFSSGGDNLNLLDGSAIYKVIYENRGIIRQSNTNSYMQLAKNIYSEQSDVVEIKFGLIRGGSISASGGGVYQLKVELKNNYVRNVEGPVVYNLKIMMYGDYIDEWYDYLTSPIRSYTLKRQNPPYSNALLFNNGERTNLVFSTFVIDVKEINIK